MNKPNRDGRLWLLTALLLILALSACSSEAGGGNPGLTATPRSGTTEGTTPAAGIQLGAQPCAEAVKDPAHWQAIMALTAAQQVDGVICGYLMGVPALQAVVKVGHKNMPFLLDIAVYTAIASPKPVRIFALTGLVQGDVSISHYNTLLTAQVDPNSSQNTGRPPDQQLVDLYREFKWSDSAGTLALVAFAGLYPDLSRYQAEFEQHEVNTGQGFQQWRLSAVTTAQNFAQFVLGWNPAAPTTVVSGGGTHDARAVVLIKNPAAGGAAIRLSLSRLELNTDGGLWEVTGVATDGMALTSPQSGQQLSSPVQVTGSALAFAGKLTTVTVFDHDQSRIGQAVFTEVGATGKRTVSVRVPYVPSFQGEAQEGTLALYAYNGGKTIVGTVIVKVLLGS